MVYIASNSNQLLLLNARVMPSDKLMEWVEEREGGCSGWADLTLVRLRTASPGSSFKPLGLLRSGLVSSYSQRKDWFLWEETQITSIRPRGRRIQPPLDLATFEFLFCPDKEKEDKRRKVVRSWWHLIWDLLDRTSCSQETLSAAQKRRLAFFYSSWWHRDLSWFSNSFPSLSLSLSLKRALSLSLLRTGGGHLRTLSTGRECERSRFHVWDSGEHPKEWEYFERGAHRSRHERSPNMDARRRGAGCEHGRAEVRDPRGCDCDHLPRSADRSCCWRLFWGKSSRIVED